MQGELTYDRRLGRWLTTDNVLPCRASAHWHPALSALRWAACVGPLCVFSWQQPLCHSPAKCTGAQHLHIADCNESTPCSASNSSRNHVLLAYSMPPLTNPAQPHTPTHQVNAAHRRGWCPRLLVRCSNASLHGVHGCVACSCVGHPPSTWQLSPHCGWVGAYPGHCSACGMHATPGKVLLRLLLLSLILQRL